MFPSHDRIWSAGTTIDGATLNSWTATATEIAPTGQVNLADSTSNELYWTGAQLEVGTSASDFEFLPYDVNFRRCVRYFQNQQYSSGEVLGMGYNETNSIGRGVVMFPFGSMRSVPSISTPTVTNGYRIISASHDLTKNTIPLKELISTYSFRAGNNQDTVSDGEANMWRLHASGAKVQYDAEL